MPPLRYKLEKELIYLSVLERNNKLPLGRESLWQILSKSDKVLLVFIWLRLILLIVLFAITISVVLINRILLVNRLILVGLNLYQW